MKNNLSRNIFGAFCVAWLSNSFCVAELSAKHALRFRNGDILLGNLESIEADKSVVWRRNDLLQPIYFSGTNIFEIKFSAETKSNSPTTNACRIRLRNGDWLEGKLASVDSEKIILETTFAGKMIFPRVAVQALEALPAEGQLLFSGPSSLEGWTMGKVTAVGLGEAGQWKYTNGAFYAARSASIARDLKLPDMASIQFDLAWKETLQAAVALYTSHMQPINLASKDLEPDFGGFYSLQINSFVATLMPVKKNAPLIPLGQIPVQQFSRKNRAHIEILANKSRASIALFVDGAPLKEWVDPDGFAGTGTGMRFVHQGMGALKLSSLRIAEWNGKLPPNSTNDFVGQEDLARLFNGDKVSGTLDFFREGQFTISTGNRKLNIPFARVTEINLGPRAEEKSGETVSSIRAFFADGGRVTFRLDRWNDQGVSGTSPNFGSAIFAPDTFERVEFFPASTNKIVTGPIRSAFE